jgi:hypothetical protein
MKGMGPKLNGVPSNGVVLNPNFITEIKKLEKNPPSRLLSLPVSTEERQNIMAAISQISAKKGWKPVTIEETFYLFSIMKRDIKDEGVVVPALELLRKSRMDHNAIRPLLEDVMALAKESGAGGIIKNILSAQFYNDPAVQ